MIFSEYFFKHQSYILTTQLLHFDGPHPLYNIVIYTINVTKNRWLALSDLHFDLHLLYTFLGIVSFRSLNTVCSTYMKTGYWFFSNLPHTFTPISYNRGVCCMFSVYTVAIGT